MKTQKYITVFIALGILFSSFLISCDNEAAEKDIEAEKADEQLEANIIMYESVWDDIVNNGNLDAINKNYFDENITMIAKPENIVGIKPFKRILQKLYNRIFRQGIYSCGNFWERR